MDQTVAIKPYFVLNYENWWFLIIKYPRFIYLYVYWNRKWQDYVYIQCEYKSTKQKIKHLLREENKVKENKISLKDIIDYTINSSFNRFTSFNPPERDMNRISLPLYHAHFPTWSTPIHGIWSKFLTYFRQGHNLLRILVAFMKTIILQDIIQNHNLSFAFANKLSKCIILSRK